MAVSTKCWGFLSPRNFHWNIFHSSLSNPSQGESMGWGGFGGGGGSGGSLRILEVGDGELNFARVEGRGIGGIKGGGVG
jgi:hypothetical protein